MSLEKEEFGIAMKSSSKKIIALTILLFLGLGLTTSIAIAWGATIQSMKPYSVKPFQCEFPVQAFNTQASSATSNQNCGDSPAYEASRAITPKRY